CQHYHKIPYSF
nr:immunoglobulin light chain junction region [Macaca mulatta]